MKMVMETTAASGSPGQHTYLRIRPSNDSLTADRLTAQFAQLHEVLDTPVEFLLVADPAADEIAYYVGAPPESLPTLRRVVTRIAPDQYAITEPDIDPLAALPDPDTADHLATAELQGVGERNDDWQTRLRPPTLSDAPEQHEEGS
jgi:hypothetical protein